MSSLDHTSSSIADSYARALLSLTEDAGCSDEVHDTLRDLVDGMNRDQALAVFMMSRSIDDDRRTDLLEQHFRGKMHDLLLNTLQVINRKGRCELIPLVYERYRLALEELRNEIDVYVTSAIELTDAIRADLIEAATRVAGRTARLIETVDPEILGGLIVRIGDEKLDSSVSRRLERIHDAFEQRASQEIHSGKRYYEGANA